jgi:hypothetical protein
VIDSLNIFKEAQRGQLFEKFLRTTVHGTKMVVFVLDSGSPGEAHLSWEYVCDVVLRLDCPASQDYRLRTLAIVKTRYQYHVMGKHQFKIYEKFKEPELRGNGEEYNQTLRRAHPYRREGGIFVFPSIHYYLSLYKKKSTPEINAKPDPPRDWSILEFPVGRCSAFIGCRGGHKSHLGYFYLLDRILRLDEAAIVVSLRDDEAMTISTMEKIRRDEFCRYGGGTYTVSNLQAEGRLEVLYYHPGYITPEEFFHRMFVSIQRMKHQHQTRRITVLFNSLDQLGPRFPLCAKQDIFVPSIVEMLSGEGATSVLIAVEEPGQPIQQYGLLPMADFIARFSQHRFEFEAYYGHLIEARKFKDPAEEYAFREKAERINKSSAGSHVEAVVAEVVRRAAGHPAGAMGLVELVEPEQLDGSLYMEAGIHFTPLSGKFSHGTRLE